MRAGLGQRRFGPFHPSKGNFCPFGLAGPEAGMKSHVKGSRCGTSTRRGKVPPFVSFGAVKPFPEGAESGVTSSLASKQVH